MVVAEEFADLKDANEVMLFGSWTAQYLGESGRSPNDIDLLIIGDADRNLVDDAAQRVEQRVGMPVQATVRTRDQWDSAHESFIREVKSRPLLVILVADAQHSTDRSTYSSPELAVRR